MKKNLKNSILFILAAAIVLLVLSVFMASVRLPFRNRCKRHYKLKPGR